MVRSLGAVRWKLGQYLWPVRLNRLSFIGRRLTHRWQLVDRRSSPESGVVTVWDLGRERRLILGEDVSEVTQSVIFTSGSWAQLRREYWGRALALPDHLPDRPRVLVLGLGGGTMVRMIYELVSPAGVTAVDRNAVVAEVACEHMGLAAMPGLDIRIGDVRDLLPALATELPYDLVIEDVFYRGLPDGDGTQLIDSLTALVAPGGWLVMNRWFKEWNGAPVDSGQDALVAMLRERFTHIVREPITQRWFNELIAGGVPRSRQPTSQ